jgi:hypothetical protein
VLWQGYLLDNNELVVLGVKGLKDCSVSTLSKLLAHFDWLEHLACVWRFEFLGIVLLWVSMAIALVFHVAVGVLAAAEFVWITIDHLATTLISSCWNIDLSLHLFSEPQLLAHHVKTQFSFKFIFAEDTSASVSATQVTSIFVI